VSGLRLLNAAQLLGRTVILLDEVEEYTRRAWCLLEAMTADRLAGTFDVLSGMPETSDPAGSPYRHLSALLLDLPYLVWRAMLDAEVFHALTWQEALDRLEIAVTDPADLPYIYERLRAIPAPNRLHTLAGDLVTGAFPLPETAPGFVATPTGAGRPTNAQAPEDRGTLPWDGILTLEAQGPVGETAVPRTASTVPFVRWEPSDDDRPRAHVAIVAACEGEAVLLADWVDARLGEVEDLLGVDVTSRSWVADDVAPVGTLVWGGLASVAVASPNWIIVTTSARRSHCAVTAMHATTAAAAGRSLAWVIVDSGRVEAHQDFPITSAHPLTDGAHVTSAHDRGARLGGVYRRDLLAFLRGEDDE
jgi:hypothetical protein